ncbi:hypothetical protein AMJ80_03545 [bacterium SM23_31]|nr:MAG: hypothetical protein AMJ80_03545 [bacterium SM23_31]
MADIKFDPASLTEKQQEAVVEYYLGVHPRYFRYWGTTINLDIYNFKDKNFKGFKPQLKEMGKL